MLATGGSDHRVLVWRESTPNKWTVIYEFLGHSAPITALEWAPHQHGLALLAASMDGCVSLLSYLESEERWKTRTFFAHSNGVLSAAWRQVAQGILVRERGTGEFATAGADCIVRVWKDNGEEINEVCRLERHKTWVRSVSWGEELITGEEDGTVGAWEEEGEEWRFKEIANCKSPVWNICWNEYGGEIAVCSGDNITRVFAKSQGGWRIVDEFNENGKSLENN